MIRVALAVAIAFAALPAGAEASRLIYGCGSNLCSISPDGSGRRQLTHDGRRAPYYMYREPSVSRDGRRIAFARGVGPTLHSVWVADRRLRHRRRITPRLTTSLAFEPKIRPDGRAVLWLSGGDGGSLDVCWTPLRRKLALECGGHPTWDATWGPGGRFFLHEEGWTALRRGVLHFYHRSGIVIHTPPLAIYGYPQFSPDGRRLVVSETTDPGYTRIVVYDTHTWRRVRALTDRHYDSRPVWSPDGRWIAFWRDPEDPGDGLGTIGMTASIQRVPARGGPVRTVVRRARGVGPGAWAR